MNDGSTRRFAPWAVGALMLAVAAFGLAAWSFWGGVGGLLNDDRLRSDAAMMQALDANVESFQRISEMAREESTPGNVYSSDADSTRPEGVSQERVVECQALLHRIGATSAFTGTPRTAGSRSSIVRSVC